MYWKHRIPAQRHALLRSFLQCQGKDKPRDRIVSLMRESDVTVTSLCRKLEKLLAHQQVAS